MGTICYAVMISLGEMIAFLPIPGGHIKLGERFVNRAFSFTMGWNCWYNWSATPPTSEHHLISYTCRTIILPTELSAAAVLINYWNKSVNSAVWVTLFLIVVVVINLMGAGSWSIFSPVTVLMPRRCIWRMRIHIRIYQSLDNYRPHHSWSHNRSWWWSYS